MKKIYKSFISYLYILVKYAPIMTAAEQSQLNTPNLLLQSVIIVKTRMFADANHGVSTSLDFHFYQALFSVYDTILIYLKQNQFVFQKEKCRVRIEEQRKIIEYRRNFIKCCTCFLPVANEASLEVSYSSNRWQIYLVNNT